MSPLDADLPLLGLVLAYLAVLAVLGLLLGRRVKRASTFFVADRRLGAGLLFATVLAANIGAGSTVGAAGLGYRFGAAAWWWVGSAGVGTLLLASWVGPRLWRLARDHDLHTVGDYLEHRYDRRVRAVVAMLLWLGTLAILAGQLIALAWVLEVVAGVPKVAGCLVGGVVMTVYFTAGGLKGSAWVNLVQLGVLLVGFAVAVPWALSRSGGWAEVAARLPSAAEGAGEGTYLHLLGDGALPWAYLALLVPAFLVSPGLLQKVFGARDEAAVRRGVGLAGVVLLAFAALPALAGIVARALAPELDNPELALPVLLTEGLPAAVGALGLAAVISAEISSADAILFMLATSLSRDLYRRFLRPDATDAQVLRVARLAALAGGALGVALAVALPSVISSLAIFYSLLGVSLLVPVVAGLHLGRMGPPEALAAIGGGTAVLLAGRFGALGGLGGLSPTTVGLLASVAAGLGFLLLRGRRRTPPAAVGRGPGA